MQSLYGIRIFINDTQAANRVVASKPWHKGRCYQRRVQKKWTRKYGTHQMIADGEYQHDVAGGRMFCNSRSYEKLKQATGGQHGK